MHTIQDKSRVFGLDILRAAAITYVMFSHGYIYSGKVINYSYYRWLTFDGVGLFFVLSGFLIGGILIREIEKGDFSLNKLENFWMRRWLRTIPAYFAVLTFLIGCYYISHKELPPVWYKYYLFIQNFSSPHPLFFGEAWSLSVEEWFYLLVPASLFFTLKLPFRKKWIILGMIFLVLLLVTCFRIYKVEHRDYFAEGNLGNEILKVVITRMDAIMYGVFGAWLSYYFPKDFYRYKTMLFFIGILTLIGCNILFSDFFLTRVQYSLAPIATVCLLPFLNSVKEGRGWIFRVVTFISIISYSMYLTNHMIVQRGIMPFVIRGMDFQPDSSLHNILALIVFWLLTLVTAYILHRLIEKPFMELRKKLK
ncbi:MAG: acyltransferase [Bacteroidia bacterium]|nr:acyltransferase [Bacteroidia bacterium]